jgi:citrate synthase
MTTGDGLRFRTSITEMDHEEIYVRGYPLSELIQGRGYAESTYLTLRGELPGPAEARVFDAALSSLMSYPAGRGPNILAGRIAVSVNPEPAVGIFAALSCAGRHTISPEHTAAMLADGLTRLGDDPSEEEVAATATAMARERREAGVPLPGVGHPDFTEEDPRARALLAMARGHGFVGTASRLHVALVRQYNELRPGRRPLPLNIDGALARVLTELGFTPPQMYVVSLISFLPGIAAHMLEEIDSGERFRMLTTDREEYYGPARRPLPARNPADTGEPPPSARVAPVGHGRVPEK